MFSGILINILNSLTYVLVWAGIKNYRSVEFLHRNSTFFCVIWNTTQPPTTTIMVSRFPLLQNGLGRYAQSNTRTTSPRVRARARCCLVSFKKLIFQTWWETEKKIKKIMRVWTPKQNYEIIFTFADKKMKMEGNTQFKKLEVGSRATKDKWRETLKN